MTSPTQAHQTGLDLKEGQLLWVGLGPPGSGESVHLACSLTLCMADLEGLMLGTDARGCSQEASLESHCPHLDGGSVVDPGLEGTPS